MLVWFCIRAKLRAHTLRHPCLACPSRCTEHLYPHGHCKRTIIPRSHQPFQNRTIPRLALNLPPLSKGGGLTARHKLLLCCVLLAICPPFLCYKLFCRQDGGIVTPSPLPKPHYHTCFSYCNRLCVLIRFCI